MKFHFYKYIFYYDIPAEFYFQLDISMVIAVTYFTTVLKCQKIVHWMILNEQIQQYLSGKASTWFLCYQKAAAGTRRQ